MSAMWGVAPVVVAGWDAEHLRKRGTGQLSSSCPWTLHISVLHGVDMQQEGRIPPDRFVRTCTAVCLRSGSCLVPARSSIIRHVSNSPIDYPLRRNRHPRGVG